MLTLTLISPFNLLKAKLESMSNLVSKKIKGFPIMLVTSEYGNFTSFIMKYYQQTLQTNSCLDWMAEVQICKGPLYFYYYNNI